MNALIPFIELGHLSGESIAKAALHTLPQQKVTELANAMTKLPQVPQPLKHRFFPGLYVREIFNPAGSLIVTKMHKTCHMHMVVKGRISVWIEGIGVKVYEAGHIGTTSPGTRRIIYAHEDTVFMTWHVTDKTNVDEIEKDCVYEETNDTLPVEANVIEQLQNPKERGDV